MTAEIARAERQSQFGVYDVGCSPSVCYFCECFVLVSLVTHWPLDMEYIVSRVVKEKIEVGCVHFSKGYGRRRAHVCGRGNQLVLKVFVPNLIGLLWHHFFLPNVGEENSVKGC